MKTDGMLVHIKNHLGRVRRKLQVISTRHHAWQIHIRIIAAMLLNGNFKVSSWIDMFTILDVHCVCNMVQTLRTIVIFGFRAAKPPGGSRGAPVTNCRKARRSSNPNSWMISNSCKIIYQLCDNARFKERLNLSNMLLEWATLFKTLTLVTEVLLAV